jgi:hypothetical protein
MILRFWFNILNNDPRLAILSNGDSYFMTVNYTTLLLTGIT